MKVTLLAIFKTVYCTNGCDSLTKPSHLQLLGRITYKGIVLFGKMYIREVFNTKRFIIASIAYLTTGIGFYHTFLGDSIVYGSLILTVGLLGILHDIFYKNLYA